MAPKKVTRRPGYDPGAGRPDPEEQLSPIVEVRQGTHLPGLEGPPCGLRPAPTDPTQYDAAAPSCPECANYKKRAEAVTAGIVARSKAARAAAIKAGG